MKTKALSLIICCCFMFSCTKQGEHTSAMLKENTLAENAVLLKSGTFVPTAGITVSGKAELRTRSLEHFVSLIDLNISSGPDLKVYLSTSDSPTNFVNLGALESDKSVYKIPEGVTLDEYSYVLIHCQQYNHLFAIAKLNK